MPNQAASTMQVLGQTERRTEVVVAAGDSIQSFHQLQIVIVKPLHSLIAENGVRNQTCLLRVYRRALLEAAPCHQWSCKCLSPNPTGRSETTFNPIT